MLRKIGKIFLSLCVAFILSGRVNITIAEAPRIPPSQLNRQEKKIVKNDIPDEIDQLCKEYNFNYPTLMKKLAWAESRYGQDKRCGDGGEACGLYQWHYSTWKEFQKKFNRYDLDWNNNRDQIVMTILALKHGYWYRWGTLLRWYKGNPI